MLLLGSGKVQEVSSYRLMEHQESQQPPQTTVKLRSRLSVRPRNQRNEALDLMEKEERSTAAREPKRIRHRMKPGLHAVNIEAPKHPQEREIEADATVDAEVDADTEEPMMEEAENMPERLPVSPHAAEAVAVAVHPEQLEDEQLQEKEETRSGLLRDLNGQPDFTGLIDDLVGMPLRHHARKLSEKKA